MPRKIGSVRFTDSTITQQRVDIFSTSHSPAISLVNVQQLNHDQLRILTNKRRCSSHDQYARYQECCPADRRQISYAVGVGIYKIEALGPLPRALCSPVSFGVLAMDDDIRQRIINSLFSRRGPSGVVEEQYISHCKIYEDAGPNQTSGLDEAGRKARYILLSRIFCSLLTLLSATDRTRQSLALAQRRFTSQRQILMARSQSERRGIWKTFAVLRFLVWVSSSTVATPRHNRS